jgi:WD40 repeat protein
MSRDPEPYATLDPDNPWPGLLSFREQDQHFFGGRDKAIEELLRRVVAEPLTLVFGPSGLGKTSLLRAGLFPRLRDEHFFPVYIRLEYVSGRGPLAQIKEEIVKQAAAWNVEATPPDDIETLWEYLHRRDVDFWDERSYPCTPVLVLDQFEELFTKGRAFIDELADTLSPLTEGGRPEVVNQAMAADQSLHARYHGQRRYRVMFAIREDYVAQLHALSDRFRSVFTNWFSVQRMSGQEALTSVMKAGWKVLDEPVARRIVRFVGRIGDDPHEEPVPGEQLPVDDLWIEPALLSVICSELNVTRKESHAEKITVSMLAERKEAILTSFLNRSFEDVSPKLSSFVEDELVLDGKTRDSIAVRKALEIGISEADIQKLVDRRVLRRQEIDGVPRIELTHDLLTSEVVARGTRRHATEEARREEEAKLAAARAAQEEAERERAEARKAQELAEAARDAAKRVLWRTRIAFLAVAVLFAVTIGSWLYIRFLRAETQRKEARELFRYANLAFDDGRDSDGLATLARALHRDPRNDTARALVYDRLLRGGWWLPVAAHDGPGSDVQPTSVSISSDGRRLAALAKDRIAVWDVASGKLVAALPVAVLGRVLTARFLSNPRFIRITARPRSFVWDTGSGEKLVEIPVGGDVSPDGAEIASRRTDRIRFLDVASGATSEVAVPVILGTVRFAPDRRHLLLSYRGDSASQYRLWNRETRAFVGDPLDLRMLRNVTFSSDSRTLVTLDVQGVRAWNVATGTMRGKPIAGGLIALVLSPDGSRIVITSGTEARAFDEDGDVSYTLRHDERVSSVVFSADGKRVLTTANDGTVRCWDETGSPIGAPLSHDGRAVRAQFMGDDSTIVTVSDRVRIWRLPRALDEPLMKVSSMFGDPAHASADLAVFEDSGGEEARHVALDLGKSTERWQMKAETSSALAVSAGSRSVAFGRDLDDGRAGIVVADGGSGKTLWQHDYAGESVEDAGFTANDDVLVVLTVGRESQRRVRFMSTRTWREVAKAIQAKEVDTLAISPAGDFVALVDSSGGAQVWDWRRGVKIGTIDSVSALGFSPDGRRLVVSSRASVSLYEVGTELRKGRELDTEGDVDLVAFSPDGRTIVTSSSEVALFDAASAERRRRPISRALSVAPHFSADGKRVALFFSDDTAQVCDVETGWPVTRPLPVDGFAAEIALMSKDGESMFRIQDGMLVRTLIPRGSSEESAVLVKLAEVMAGKRVGEDGFDPVDTTADLAALVRECAGKTDRPCRFVRWFHRDHTKTISPLSTWTHARYDAFKPPPQELEIDMGE